MSLKIRVKNLGILKHAEFSLGDLTIICGGNNTGKTYATYALYGFLRDWRDLIRFPVNDAQIQSLLTDGVLKINLSSYVKSAERKLAITCKRYTTQLDNVFAAREGQFHSSEFHIQPDVIDLRDKEYAGKLPSDRVPVFTYLKEKGSEELTVALSVERDLEKETDPNLAASAIRFAINKAIFSDSFPNPFISSAERTGVAIFRKELNFARNRLLEEMGQSKKKINPWVLLSKAYQSYPSTIEDNVDFTRQLEEVAKRKSFLAKEHPEVLEDFADIIGGDYDVTQNDQLYYVPKRTQRRLTMLESSSAVRSLLDLGFYLRCVAQKGDLLMIDEPELNLHPANQRRIARLFARLVNAGVKVFITTHSDYIVKELNTLIMLNHDDVPHLKRIAEENGYQRDELIKAYQVKVYMAKEAVLPLEEEEKGRSVFEVDDEIVTLAGINRDEQKRERGHTLVPADIHPRFGIEVDTFDDTIEDINRIQDDVIWGAE